MFSPKNALLDLLGSLGEKGVVSNKKKRTPGFGWWFFRRFWGMFTPKIGEESHFGEYFFLKGLKPPTSPGCMKQVAKDTDITIYPPKN